MFKRGVTSKRLPIYFKGGSLSLTNVLIFEDIYAKHLIHCQNEHVANHWR